MLALKKHRREANADPGGVVLKTQNWVLLLVFKKQPHKLGSAWRELKCWQKAFGAGSDSARIKAPD